MATLAEFKTNEKSWWCPGCGDFGVLAALQKALVNLGLEPRQVAIVAGIGCSGKIGNYVNAYNFHVVHGRALPTAMGLKLANQELTVIAAGGDGDGYAIGMSHFLHALRRNANITYLVMDNHIYGLTKGQFSPTSDPGFKTKSTPEGNIERPVKPLQLALAAGATFVAQGFSSNIQQMTRLIEAGVRHRGFSLINAISPCVTYNKVNTYDWYKEVLANLDEDPAYDAADRELALRTVIAKNELVTGLIFQERESLAYEDKIAGYKPDRSLVKADLDLDPKLWQQLVGEFR